MSGIMTLEPGDLIATGTPAGTAAAARRRRRRSRDPRRGRSLQPRSRRRDPMIEFSAASAEPARIPAGRDPDHQAPPASKPGMDVIDLGAGDNDTPPPAVAVRGDAGGPPRPGATASTGSSRGCRRSGMRPLAGWSGGSASASIRRPRRLPLIGSKEGLSHLPFAVINPGDVAIVPEPGYQAYLGGSLLAGAEPYIAPLRPENGFLLELDQIPEAVLRRAEDRLRQLSQQPDGGGRDARVSRAHGRHLPPARDPARLRQRLLRPDVRRLPRAEHLRDRGSAGCGARVLLAVEELLDDRLAAGLRGRAAPS